MTEPESRRRLPSADRRQQILEVAARLFVQRGFEAVSMADLAAALGVSRPTVYSYFGSTLAVLEALLAERLQALWKHLAPLLAGARPHAQFFGTLFHFLLGERDTLSLLHCGGGPSFQARRQAFLAELGARIEPERQPGLSGLPDLLLIVTSLLDSLAFRAVSAEALEGAPLDTERLAASLDTFVRGGVAALLQAAPKGSLEPDQA